MNKGHNHIDDDLLKKESLGEVCDEQKVSHREDVANSFILDSVKESSPASAKSSFESFSSFFSNLFSTPSSKIPPCDEVVVKRCSSESGTVPKRPVTTKTEGGSGSSKSSSKSADKSRAVSFRSYLPLKSSSVRFKRRSSIDKYSKVKGRKGSTSFRKKHSELKRANSYAFDRTSSHESISFSYKRSSSLEEINAEERTDYEQELKEDEELVEEYKGEDEKKLEEENEVDIKFRVRVEAVEGDKPVHTAALQERRESLSPGISHSLIDLTHYFSENQHSAKPCNLKPSSELSYSVSCLFRDLTGGSKKSEKSKKHAESSPKEESKPIVNQEKITFPLASFPSDSFVSPLFQNSHLGSEFRSSINLSLGSLPPKGFPLDQSAMLSSSTNCLPRRLQEQESIYRDSNAAPNRVSWEPSPSFVFKSPLLLKERPTPISKLLGMFQPTQVRAIS